MSRENLPEQSRGFPAARRPAGGVERSQGAAVPAAHEAGSLGFIEGPDRFHWWAELSNDVKAYIERKVGPAVEWWADWHERERDRPYAVVLGTNGLAVTTPKVNQQGQRTQTVHVDAFVPSSLKHAVVQQLPTRPRTRLLSRGKGEQPPAAPQLELTSYMRGVLGNLPLEAQQRLQTPFLGSQPIKHYRSYYYGNEEDLNLWLYLAGDRTVTFASGHRTLPAGADPKHAAWHLVCYQADIAR
ncbi:hypothetical protein GCM10009630_29940 [Kribbella jejuensis]|uniref:Uncharacterized protein n=1 Tax=Kribbella jejuensis TaxID=236068 RepID=A0A542EQ99_9ACTN|nr:hypothetical protein [Kribbella jejuensis]TQJ17499.1 hypothetical protein FB475_1619 [Kribbella jejuensis]